MSNSVLEIMDFVKLFRSLCDFIFRGHVMSIFSHTAMAETHRRRPLEKTHN
jgi:hypothetical protein